MAKRLTPRQRRFIEEFLLDLNATQAAVRAGYAEATANREASRLLSNVDIQQAVTEAQEARSRRTAITADRVLKELAVTAFSSVWDYQIDDTGQLALAPKADEASIRAVASVRRKVRHLGQDGEGVEYETEVRLWPKVQALKLAGLHLGLFKERTPLEELLAALPPELAGALRQALAQVLAGGTGGTSAQPPQLPPPEDPAPRPGPGDVPGGAAP